MGISTKAMVCSWGEISELSISFFDEQCVLQDCNRHFVLLI